SASAGADQRRADTRRGLGASDEDFLVLFAGKFIPVKRPADVIVAAGRLGPHVVVALAGNGPLMADTRAAAARCGVRTRWCGFLNQGALHRVLAAADGVALPMHAEGCGQIVDEVRVYCTPVLVHERGGCLDD